MNVRRLLLLLLVVAVNAPAAVYKWVDAEGNIHYGDQPPAGAPADPLKLPGLSTYRTPAQDAGDLADGTTPQAPFSGYTRIAIARPKANAVVRNNQQRVPVQITLEPALQPAHHLVIYLDNKPVGGPVTTLSMHLQGVERGGHSLKVEVVDAGDKTLAVSSTVYFTLRQAALGETATPPDNGDQPDYTPAKDQGKDYTPPAGTPPYTPPADPAGDFQPANGAAPHKPGTTAPGFKPNYTP